MYVVAVPNRNSRPAILLRESYRDGARVKNRTLANLSTWAPERVDALRQVLRGQPVSAGRLEGAFEIVRSRPHGHVAAVLGTVRRLGLDGLLAPRPDRRRHLALALIVARVLDGRNSRRRAAWIRTRSRARSANSWGSAARTKTISTRRWTGCWRARRASSKRWPAAT